MSFFPTSTEIKPSSPRPGTPIKVVAGIAATSTFELGRGGVRMPLHDVTTLTEAFSTPSRLPVVPHLQIPIVAHHGLPAPPRWARPPARVRKCGKRNNKKEEPPVFKPTSCGPLPINNGATAFEEDPDNPGEKLLVEGPPDPETMLPTLVPVVIVGPSNSLGVEAVEGAKPCVEG